MKSFKKIPTCILTALLFSIGIVSGQAIHFKKYKNLQFKFSLDLPAYWQIKYRKQQEGLICVPLTKDEKELYNDCYEGIVFRLGFYKSDLDSTLNYIGVYTKSGDNFYTSDRERDSVKAENIKGKNWVGIYHNNVCGITCNETGFHAVAGQCEFIYFSNGKVTISINTNGREFDEKILKRILSSFLFN